MPERQIEKLSYGRTLLWIFLLTVFVSGSGFMGWLYYLHLRELRLHDEQYKIVAIVQTTPQQDGLKTIYLAELLQLSIDQPTNLYAFDSTQAVQKLLKSPLIKEAKVQKIRPGTLYIHYQMRNPIAYLADYTNTALDAEGILFPFTPFFTPKKLPKIYLGLDQIENTWGSSILEDERTRVAIHVLNKVLADPHFRDLHLKQIDVSKAFSESYGQRQIILIVEKHVEQVKQGRRILAIKPYILRLDADKYLVNLIYLRQIKEYLDQEPLSIPDLAKGTVIKLKPAIIDLRIPKLAFIKNES